MLRVDGHWGRARAHFSHFFDARTQCLTCEGPTFSILLLHFKLLSATLPSGREVGGTMPKKNRGGGGMGGSRGMPLVLISGQRVAAARLPINPLAGAAGRYKMPQLVCIVHGKGKSTRTDLDNLADVASALERPLSYLMHFFQYSLSVKVHSLTHNSRSRHRSITLLCYSSPPPTPPTPWT